MEYARSGAVKQRLPVQSAIRKHAWWTGDLVASWVATSSFSAMLHLSIVPTKHSVMELDMTVDF